MAVLISSQSPVFSQQKITETRSNTQIHTDNCHIKPQLILTERSIDINQLKDYLLYQNGTSKQAVSLIHGQEAGFSAGANGVVQITEKGDFLVPWMRWYLPNELKRCSDKVEEEAFNYVYATQEDQLDLAVLKAQKCYLRDRVGGALMYSLESFDHDAFQMHDYKDKKISVSALNDLFFHKVLNVKKNVNTSVKFQFDVEILGDNINCNLSDIQDALLFCIDNRYQDKTDDKVFYASSPLHLKNVLQDFCQCQDCTEAEGCVESRCAVTPVEFIENTAEDMPEPTE